ncbi:hypothetical protein ABTX15_17020 [Micromonospora sp. NPDC094482]|uniref:hypothetical protein n=1 Tax=unclassified Micromonospora TaxID=2617518 RepID=UPI00332958CD
MNAHRMDPETVERLLGGPVVDHDGLRPLVLLLTALRAAPRPGELDGEHAAVQAFHHAFAAPADPPRRRRASTVRMGLRAALATLALAATGGVALAATGTLPGGPPQPTTTVPAPSASPGQGSSGANPGPEAGPGTAGRPTPAAAVVGLCRAYREKSGDDRGRALESPAFTGLVNAAGGPGRVADYCDQVLADEPSHGKPSDRPAVPAHPSARPTKPPNEPPGRPDEPGNGERRPPSAGPKTPATDGRSGG